MHFLYISIINIAITFQHLLEILLMIINNGPFATGDYCKPGGNARIVRKRHCPSRQLDLEGTHKLHAMYNSRSIYRTARPRTCR